MNERSIFVLELPKIRERLASHASFAAGRELALALTPLSDVDAVRRHIRATAEAKRLLTLKPALSLAGARDIRPLLKRALVGGRLEPAELLDVLGTLQSGRALRSNIVRLDGQLPILAAVAEQIADCPQLENEIVRCIGERAEVLTDASPALARIRGELRGSRERLLSRLTEILASAAFRPMIQEPIITQRDGRHVIPVKAEFKGQFRGIIHDQSASGATVFIEPLATVELNNRVRDLELAEEHEIDRLLRVLSGIVATDAAILESNVEALAELDLDLAKAKYAAAIHATEPDVVRETAPEDGVPSLQLRQARHPLLGERVVPIDVVLGGDFRVLVITGPNTGGKTVALKTVGLLALMARCGMHLPAAEGSRVPIFHKVFADIGDEQSIEQSLSTFSSHMRNVVGVLREADARSLVLLDELGAGTDPTEGAALAQAIIDFLLQRGALVVATTHYSELKAYAHNTAAVENASVEFDADTLTPTYRLSIGLPGKSNALAIATRLGVPPSVIEDAQSRVRPSEAEVEHLLGEIRAERDRARGERNAVEKEAAEAERLRASLRARLEGIERERQGLLAAAREEARKEAEREIAVVREQLQAAARALEDARHDRVALLAGLRETARLEREVERRREDDRPPMPQPKPVRSLAKGSIRAGDAVLVGSLNQEGDVLSLSEGGKEAEVQVGNFKLRLPVSSLHRLGRAKAAPRLLGEELHLEPRPAVPLEIEVRGWRAEEVPPVLDKYIHDAYLAGLPFVRVIHGKGTGVLRRLVREQLAANPLVQAMRHPEPRDGGEGVTIVELAN